MPAFVQINFDYQESQTELEAGSAQAAALFTDIDGLLWKIWLVDEASKRADGIYLFATRKQADACARSDLVTHLKANRTKVSVLVSTANDAPGTVTRAPV